MDLDDFELCLKEMKLLGADNIKMQAALHPGYMEIDNVGTESKDPFRLLIKMKKDSQDIEDVLLFRRKKPRRMSPEAFFQEIRSSAYDGDGAVVK